ncbi:hypothetical protein V757_03125 [Pelistega indica]|uniref:Glycosyltransferase 2-like domain-containing protein n=1 Tax=Pelistega indica TaxID=1414851 RepID=V8G7Z1_9BURK|nr:glycosyltransferase family 2 protein [Pelistega indica]ETD72654.1 hypothetical protein V757_03125 [Pelistega indica]
MRFQILMATMHKQKISDINWDEKGITSDVLLINQSDFSGRETSGKIQMISTTDRGSSNSRNLAIDNALGDICLIADDDVKYLPGYEEKILAEFAKYPEADIITFQIQTPEGNKFNMGYPDVPMKHSWRSILKCASIEIAFRRDAINKAQLRLNKLFGLGSHYRIHDEIIFLKEALDKGLNLRYAPIPVVIHPAESSGTDFNDHLIYSKGAAFAKLFAYKAYAFNIVFSIKKYALYKKNKSFWQFLALMNKGTADYLKGKY